MKGVAETLNVSSSGGSDLIAKQLVVENCTVHASGGSDAWVNVQGELTIFASGASDVYYTGPAKIVTMKSSGGADVEKY